MNDIRWLPLVFAVLIAFAYFGLIMQAKFRLLLVTEHRARFLSDIPKRFANMMTIAFGQKKMFKEPGAGIMHAFIFWGFLVLQIRTAYVMVCAFYPGAQIPFIHHPYTLMKELTALVVLGAVIWAAYRRIVVKPKRLSLSGEAIVILGMIGGLMVSDMLLDGFAYALAQKDVGFENALFFDWNDLGTAAQRHEAITSELAWAPIGSTLASLFSGVSAQTLMSLQELAYWLHIGIVLVFLNMLPGSKHFHVITSIPNTFFADLKPRGALEQIKDMDKQEKFGVGDVKDFTWKQVLDTYTCTECGRCEVNCPTTITGKVLNPKFLILDIRNHLYSREKELIAAGTHDAAGWEIEKHGKTLIEEVKEEAIWDCTTCRACSEACPVMIEHVDKIVDMRRHLVLMEASFPKELKQTFKNLESKGNPWGLPTKDRIKWAEGLDIPMLADAPDAEYVFWVGCAGAYDERQKKVSRALVNLLREAGVKFAIMGEDEGCTGDPARRAGNEYLFQQQATANVEAMNAAGMNKKKLVTHCPHCFNTIKNEYPQFGGNFEIVHHSVLIERLVRDGRLKPVKKPEGVTRVTYHDSCYIGRYNDVYEEPRNALSSIPGIELKEMARNRTTGMCCGAGGARVWMEEHRGKRINHVRVEQAMETGADTIAVACPFCNLMMDDGIGAKQANVKARDVAELVWESLGKS